MWSVSELNIGCNGPYFLFEKAVSENRYRIVNNQDPVDGMNGSDFRRKSVGPVLFEMACTSI